jgi:hypothetical protein
MIRGAIVRSISLESRARLERTISLGRNPIKGGNPARERKLIVNINLMVDLLGIMLILLKDRALDIIRGRMIRTERHK